MNTEEPIRITVEADGAVLLERDMESDGGPWTQSIKLHAFDLGIDTVAIRQQYAENARLREALETIAERLQVMKEECSGLSTTYRIAVDALAPGGAK